MSDKKIENLFNYINSRMFSIMSCKDRRSNYELLRVLQDLFEMNGSKVGLDKDELVDALATFIKDREFVEFDDDEGNSIADRSPRDKALTKIRQFKKTGWLEEDTTEGFTVVMYFSDYATDLMNAFLGMIDRNEHRQIEYTGYFYSIHALLSNFEYERCKAIIGQIVEITRSLFSSLRGLNSTIRRYFERLINRTDITPSEIMMILLEDYNTKVLGAFRNLLGRDNPSRYTTDILDKLNALRHSPEDREIIRMAGCYIETSEEKQTSENLNRVVQYLKDTLDNLILRFGEVDDLIHVIATRNSMFHVAAVSRLEFLINNRKDIEGLLVQAMKNLAKADENQDFDSITPLYSISELDDKSLYNKTFNRNKITTYVSNPPQVSEEEMEEAFKRLEGGDRMSREIAEQYAMSLLQDLPAFRTEDIKHASIEDIINLMAVEIFGAYEGLAYGVNFRDDDQSIAGYTMKAFDIINKSRSGDIDGR